MLLHHNTPRVAWPIDSRRALRQLVAKATQPGLIIEAVR
jgi:hypothetical protein